MKKFRSLILVSLAFVFMQSAFAQGSYDTYGNSRFEYLVSYPTSVLIPQGEAANGDGRVFVSKDKTCELRVWGQYNALFKTIKSAYNEDLKERGDGVTYKVLGKDSYVISGVKSSKIYYQKTILNGNDGDGGAVFATFVIEYRKRDKAKYDPIVRKIAASFKFD